MTEPAASSGATSAMDASTTSAAPDQSASTNAPTMPAATTSTSDPKATEPGSLADPGARKPRDARVVHLFLSSMGVTAYQERVPLMLMDFAYRYTSSILQDALLFSDIINSTPNTGGQNPPASISNDDLRMSIASRVSHQFSPGLPKDFLLDIAAERNRVALPTVGLEFGVRLPPEKYCLTGINWDMADGMSEYADLSDEGEDMQFSSMGTMMGVGGGGGGDTGGDDDKMDVDDLLGGTQDQA